jgi:peptidoglycan/LPS O-acetylase OafA/YrhL
MNKSKNTAKAQKQPIIRVLSALFGIFSLLFAIGLYCSWRGGYMAPPINYISSNFLASFAAAVILGAIIKFMNWGSKSRLNKFITIALVLVVAACVLALVFNAWMFHEWGHYIYERQNNVIDDPGY